MVRFDSGWGDKKKMEAALLHIPEGDYVAHFERVRQELARRIAYSGLSLAEIARGTRMKWDTVYAASQGRPIRMENAARIEYFLYRQREAETGVKL